MRGYYEQGSDRAVQGAIEPGAGRCEHGVSGLSIHECPFCEEIQRNNEKRAEIRSEIERLKDLCELSNPVLEMFMDGQELDDLCCELYALIVAAQPQMALNKLDYILRWRPEVLQS